MKILFLVPYPLKEAPSQRFRFEQYLDHLSGHGHHYEVHPFLNSDEWRMFYKSGNTLRKVIALIRGFGLRWLLIFKASGFDFIFIHREAAPLGPPLIEWILYAILRKKIIYDFDDSIWLTDRQNENPLRRVLKWRSKVKSICAWSHKVSCGNEFLQSFAAPVNPNAIVNPTTIDTEHLHNPQHGTGTKATDQVTIGWTGSHSTLKYLDALENVIRLLESKYPQLRFLVIADRKPMLSLKSMLFKPWSIDSEIQDLATLDIGIMPLEDDEWSKGKCGFKALQYMALEIPAVVSPVGVNLKIIQDGYNGFLCNEDEQWVSKLDLLIKDHELRTRLGREARRTIERHYSVTSNLANFLSLFD